MNRLLDVPWVVNEGSERISTHGGLATIDFNGSVTERRETMRLVAQAQEMAKALMPLANTQCERGRTDCAAFEAFMRTAEPGYASYTAERCPPCRALSVLRAAGVLP